MKLASKKEIDEWQEKELKWWGDRQLKFITIAVAIQISALLFMAFIMYTTSFLI